MPRKFFFRGLLVALVLTSAAFAQWHEEVLHNFRGGTDGYAPVGSVVIDAQGNLYGATSNGGAYTCLGVGGCGVAYELSPPMNNGDPWTETILHRFRGFAFHDGAVPEGGLTKDDAGNLYGTTAYDGTRKCSLVGGLIGCGTVYELSPPSRPDGVWTETVLYSFQGGNDGYFPWGELVLDKAGNLYGATRFGGGKGTDCGGPPYVNCGTIFELSPAKQPGGAWTEKVLYSFAGVDAGDGAQPNGGLTFDDAGDIYGTTWVGGTNASGCSAEGGCGTAFELAPQANGAWTENVIYQFQGYPYDGANPNGSLIFKDNAVSGTTFSAGSPLGFGTFYSLEPSGNEWEEIIHRVFFTSHNPNSPTGGLTLTSDGTLLGTAHAGGQNYVGAVFQLTPPRREKGWSLTNLHSFGSPPDGAAPVGGLTAGTHGEYYGVTEYGGNGSACNGGCGTMFAVRP